MVQSSIQQAAAYFVLVRCIGLRSAQRAFQDGSAPGARHPTRRGKRSRAGPTMGAALGAAAATARKRRRNI